MAEVRPPLLTSDWGEVDADAPPDPRVWARVFPRLVARYAEITSLRAELEAAHRDASRAGMAAAPAAAGLDGAIAERAHALRTAINAVLGYADLARSSLVERGDDALAADVERIERAGRALLALVEEAVGRARRPPHRTPTALPQGELARVVSAAVALAREASPDTAFALELPQDASVAGVDAARLGQWVELLAHRAALAAPGHPVAVRAWREDAAVVVEVTDRGPAPGLARPGPASHPAEDPSDEQLGFGLAWVRRLVRRAGGAFAVTSGADGTTVHLRVPAVEAVSTRGTRAVEALGARSARLDPRTVLVIDDDPEVQDLVGRILARDGFRVVGAADGEGGLAQARRLRPRGILLDLRLPGPSGWQVLEALKRDPELAAIPVVVLSGVDDPARSAALGAEGHLAKPFDREALRSSVHRFVRSGDVLVVEDDPATRQLLRAMLERDGVPVRAAAHGAEALALLEAAVPGLVLLDLVMPVMDGLALLGRIRANPAWKDLPVVVTTGKDLAPDELAALQRGAARVMTKHAHPIAEVLSHAVSVVRG